MRGLAASLALAVAGCAAPTASGNAAVYDAWRAGRSHVEVTASGSVARFLGERSGRYGPHAGFLLHLGDAAGHGLTVRVEANEDFTGRLPFAAGEAVRVRGEYEYDSRGGVIHWTHRDPRHRHPDGFIEAGGREFG